MKLAKGWQWLLVALMAAACSLMAIGCDDGGDDDDDGTPAPAANEGDDEGDGDGEEADDPAVTTKVLLDTTQVLSGGGGFGVETDASPSAGTVKITASWTAIDLMAAGAPIDIPLEFRVNVGLNAGGFTNPGHESPFTGSVGVPASFKSVIQVFNNVSDSQATVHLKATWTAD